ncbi:hypothetical protein HYPSUDRAFT_460483 [Hypholoma sublateritium FD-334 SS-4]|uniref:F-box domain-containing protein n=1 Tax=Hypholoma sublateritium (strain FD-334 SS-4) TaxID=945553 RepID=A0A0D2NC85_HYPSF|nr:hypothetical protein HYPSUDRAFT_460483 [Hypholoma sublateritium FD-334 SS-4]
MGYIRAPALESLIYTSIDAPSEIDPPDSLLKFLRHSPGIKELSLTVSRSKYFSSQAYCNFLLLCSFLRSFRIGHRSFGRKRVAIRICSGRHRNVLVPLPGVLLLCCDAARHTGDSLGLHFAQER